MNMQLSKVYNSPSSNSYTVYIFFKFMSLFLWIEFLCPSITQKMAWMYWRFPCTEGGSFPRLQLPSPSAALNATLMQQLGKRDSQEPLRVGWGLRTAAGGAVSRNHCLLSSTKIICGIQVSI